MTLLTIIIGWLLIGSLGWFLLWVMVQEDEHRKWSLTVLDLIMLLICQLLGVVSFILWMIILTITTNWASTYIIKPRK